MFNLFDETSPLVHIMRFHSSACLCDWGSATPHLTAYITARDRADVARKAAWLGGPMWTERVADGVIKAMIARATSDSEKLHVFQLLGSAEVCID